MSEDTEVPLPPLDGWALILGVSSGFGAAAATCLARAGVNIVGVHLDRRSTMPEVKRIQAAVEAEGREAWFYNVNAADPGKRAEVLDDVHARFKERGKDEWFRVLLHSLAFGTLKPFVADDVRAEVDTKQIDMTCNVMAHSLVYWTQDVLRRELMRRNGRIYAMTSTGSSEVWKAYGAVSAAKASLEAHIRQLGHELAPQGITANAICAGVTETPALKKIPGSNEIAEVALRKNPYGRLTGPMDVGRAIVALAQPCTYWMTSNVLYVDGGEAHAG